MQSTQVLATSSFQGKRFLNLSSMNLQNALSIIPILQTSYGFIIAFGNLRQALNYIPSRPTLQCFVSLITSTYHCRSASIKVGTSILSSWLPDIPVISPSLCGGRGISSKVSMRCFTSTFRYFISCSRFIPFSTRLLDCPLTNRSHINPLISISFFLASRRIDIHLAHLMFDFFLNHQTQFLYPLCVCAEGQCLSPFWFGKALLPISQCSQSAPWPWVGPHLRSLVLLPLPHCFPADLQWQSGRS